MTSSQLLTSDEQQRIIAAIQQAERNTSGEIRVHIEAHCPEEDVLKRAIQVFFKLEMNKTAQQNGVLFYLATEDRKFAVIGDKGIDAVVPPNFWESTREVLREHFRADAYAEGLCRGIEMAGLQLKKFFPSREDDTNELSDEISF